MSVFTLQHLKKLKISTVYPFIEKSFQHLACTNGLPWTVAPQDPLSTGFPRQAYWWPFPSPGDLPNPRVDTASPALADGFFTTEPPGKPKSIVPQ